MSKGLYLKYEPAVGDTDLVRIYSYRFEGEGSMDSHEKDAGEGRVFIIKCKCGSNDWTDNGRTVNEYECDGCGGFLEAYQSK